MEKQDAPQWYEPAFACLRTVLAAPLSHAFSPHCFSPLTLRSQVQQGRHLGQQVVSAHASSAAPASCKKVRCALADRSCSLHWCSLHWRCSSCSRWRCENYAASWHCYDAALRLYSWLLTEAATSRNGGTEKEAEAEARGSRTRFSAPPGHPLSIPEPGTC